MNKMMKRLQEKKGFTLAELLIVVAIIAVLVAIAIPIFSAQLEKSREATDVANVRSAYAEVVAKYLETGEANNMSVTAVQTIDGWQTDPQPVLKTQIDGKEGELKFNAVTKNGSYNVKLEVGSNGSVTVNVGQ